MHSDPEMPSQFWAVVEKERTSRIFQTASSHWERRFSLNDCKFVSDWNSLKNCLGTSTKWCHWSYPGHTLYYFEEKNYHFYGFSQKIAMNQIIMEIRYKQASEDPLLSLKLKEKCLFFSLVVRKTGDGIICLSKIIIFQD